METKTPYSRPFVEWATALTDKYRFNPFVRSTIHIMVLQLLLALLMIGAFYWGVRYTQENTIDSITTHLMEAMALGATSTPTLAESVEEVRDRTFTILMVGVIGFNLLFGYILARFALKPTKNSLRSQKQFIGNVAHELRTPLAIIKTNTEVALFDQNLKADVRTTFEDTLVELDRISEIINNLLTFDTLTRPRKMEFAPIDMREVAKTVLKRHEALARERGIALTVEQHEEPTMVSGNATALEQVVTNLVKNALNYTPQHSNGSVRIITRKDGLGRIVVTVADTGIGIAQKDLFHIFEPFYRGDTSRARNIGTGSSGLGLAIVNELVRLHKGSVSIRSHVGHGTSIRLSFPEAKESGLSDPLVESDNGTNEVSVDFSDR